MCKFVEFYKKMYLIRKVEDIIRDNYYDDEMKTPMHMSKGSEAIAVGVCSALGNRGQYFSTYRSHAPYLASGGNLNEFFAEMYGKKEGKYAGKAGSMHIASPSTGHISSSAIVASNIPVAVGAAWANKIQDNGKIVVVFFGDGALDEGGFWESINMACLWKLPIIFVCEDNRLAVHTPSSERQGYNDIINVVNNFKMNTISCSGLEVDFVECQSKKAIMSIDTNEFPFFLRFSYFRYLEHVGVNSDLKESYREKDSWWLYGDDVDPVSIMRCKLIDMNIDIKSIEDQISKKVNASLDFAKNDEFSDISEVYKDVFYG